MDLSTEQVAAHAKRGTGAALLRRRAALAMMGPIVRQGRKSCLLASAVLAVLLASGCVSYRAQIGREVHRGDFAARVDSVVTNRKTGAVLFDVLDVPSDVRLLGGGLSGPSDLPCEGGGAYRFGRAPARPADAPLSRGDHISLETGSIIGRWQRDPTRLDLVLQAGSGDPRCMPLPFADAGDAPTLEARERFTVGIDMLALWFVHRLGPVNAVVWFPATFGAWLGPMHVEVGGGAGATECPKSMCQVRQGETSREAGSYPVFAGIDTPLVELGEITLGLGARYTAAYLSAYTFGGHESFWIHSPQLTPYVAAVPPVVRPRAVGGAREALIGFEVPIGYAFSTKHGGALSIGIGLRIQATVF
jgi:hypothetical protein